MIVDMNEEDAPDILSIVVVTMIAMMILWVFSLLLR